MYTVEFVETKQVTVVQALFFVGQCNMIIMATTFWQKTFKGLKVHCLIINFDISNYIVLEKKFVP